MKTRRLDTSHDWTFGNNQSDYLMDSEAIKQSVLCAVLSVRNDWFLNFNHGIDWVGYLGKTANLFKMEADIKGAVLAIQGVNQITNINLDLERERRYATISIEYTDIYNRKLQVSTNVGD